MACYEHKSNWWLEVREVTTISFTYLETSGCKRLKVNRTVKGRVWLKTAQRTWDGSSKIGLVSNGQKRPALCWAPAKLTQTRPSFSSSALLTPSSSCCVSANRLSVYQQEDSSPFLYTAVPIRRGYQCIAIVQCRTTRSHNTGHSNTTELTMQQRAHWSLKKSLDALRMKLIFLRIERALMSWGCHLLLEI